MSRRPWMPMYWGDYLKDTTTLTTKQHGYYVLLIAHYWEHGTLPPSAAARQRVTKTNNQADGNCWKVVSQYFTPDGKHKRIDKELERFENISTKRKLSGMRGASQRWQMPLPNAIPSAQLMPMAIAPHTNNKNRTSSTLSQGKEQSLIINGKDVQPTPELVALVERQNRERGVQTPAREATALPTGALARQPDAEHAAKGPTGEVSNGKAKPPHQWTRAEFDEWFASKQAAAQETTA